MILTVCIITIRHRKQKLDSQISKVNRRGKKINLLFANVNPISKYGKYYKRVHKNRNIIRDFEFFIQTKTVKKLRYEGNAKNAPVKTRTVLGRVFFLCALSETEADLWLKTLKYIETQTDKCIKEHQERIRQGIKLKNAYFSSLKNKKKPKTSSENEEGDDKDKEPEIDEKQLKKWDRAQMISVYGTGVTEAIAGQKARFIIQDNFSANIGKRGQPRKNRRRNYIGYCDLDLLSVVLETNELHYDLEVTPLGKQVVGDAKFLCEYLATRTWRV